MIIIESGGDNITTTFSPALADYFIYIVDVSGGDKYPRKRGLGIETSDLLVINKIDLANMVDANLDVMERDAKIVRKNKPHVLVNCKTNQGIDRYNIKISTNNYRCVFSFQIKNIIIKRAQEVLNTFDIKNKVNANIPSVILNKNKFFQNKLEA